MVDVANFAARNFGQGPDLAAIDYQRTKNALGQLQLNQEQAMGPLRQQAIQQGIDVGQANENRINQQNAAQDQAQKIQWLHGASQYALQHPEAWDYVVQQGKQRGIIPQDFNAPHDPQKLQDFVNQVEVMQGGAPSPKQTVVPAGGALMQEGSNTPVYINPREQPPKDDARPQLITRPAPDSGDGMVQDWTVDLKTQQLKPVGSPYPASGTGAAQLGSREGVMFQRVVSSANEAASALKNISELPVSTSTGFLGIGGSPGASAIGSTFGVLRNKIAPQAVQDYNTMLAGVGRSLSTIETAGLAPNGSLTHSMDSINLREGDTELTKLRKLAEMRQIIEKGIEPNLSNPRLPPEQKELIRGIVSSVIEAIPYTQHDITELQRRQQKEPEITLQDLISQKGLRPGTATANKRVKVDANGDVIQ